ncbi:hypothetical protein QJQ45_027498, partial [Haematococcus lacustris]
MQVAAPGAQHGDAVPDQGPDVLNKHQQRLPTLLPHGLHYAGAFGPSLDAIATLLEQPITHSLLQPSQHVMCLVVPAVCSDTPTAALYSSPLPLTPSLQPQLQLDLLPSAPGESATAWAQEAHMHVIRCCMRLQLHVYLPEGWAPNQSRQGQGQGAQLDMVWQGAVDRAVEVAALQLRCQAQAGGCLAVSRSGRGHLMSEIQPTALLADTLPTPSTSPSPPLPAPARQAQPTAQPPTLIWAPAPDLTLYPAHCPSLAPPAAADTTQGQSGPLTSASPPPPLPAPALHYQPAAPLPPSHAPTPHPDSHTAGGEGPAGWVLHSAPLALDVLGYAPPSAPLIPLSQQLLGSCLEVQLRAAGREVGRRGRAVAVAARHWLAPGRAHHLTLLLPQLVEGVEENEGLL